MVYSKVFANALLINKKKYLNKINKLRFNNAFEVHSVDNFKKYISETKKKLRKYSIFKISHAIGIKSV